MKTKLLLFAFFCISSLRPLAGKAQAVNTQDSLALVDLYNSTNGPGWILNSHWRSSFPVSTWTGVSTGGGRVTRLQLSYNRLSGTLPASLGNLTGLTALDLDNNQITGEIPASLSNLSNLFDLNLSQNQLSGKIPSSLANLPNFCFYGLSNNRFTFGDMEFLFGNIALTNHFIVYAPQEEIALRTSGSNLSVAVGGTAANTTYKWYNDNVLVSIKTGDSTYSFSSPGNYSVEVTNSILPELTLYSITNANMQDSLALVDLYNNTNGTGWRDHSNWLSVAPLSTWYGITQSKGRVVQLQLNYNELVGTIPSSIGNLTELTNLKLNSNSLNGSVPASIANLSHLTDLTLYSNSLTSIPSNLGNMASLVNIDLSNNYIVGTIPVSLGELSALQTINFGTNQFSGGIPEELNKLSNLRWLNLPYNQLSGNIPNSLSRLQNLTVLYVSNNLLTGNIPDSLILMMKLLVINLSSNQLTGKIPDSMARLTVLRQLVLNNNYLEGAIPGSLKNMSSLSELHLQNNRFTFNGMENLPSFVYMAFNRYAPQASIPIHRTGNLMAASAGGTLANNTYKLYKDGVLSDTKTADSTFSITTAGQYYITVTNSIATQLTLSTNTLSIAGLRLADTTTGITQTISGANSLNIVDTPYQSLLLTVTPTPGINALSGEVNFKVTIDPAVSSFNNQPYVQRHYDIIPTSNAAAAQATVKLYFTQQDFDNFNASSAHGLDLPSAPTDAAGIANLRVYQYHGFSTTSLPGSYSGNAVEIDPLDANVVWNAAAQYWEVSFDVTGFSGFFVSSQNNALLPVRLISFTGNRQRKETLLQWTSASEINTHYFEVQRSADGNAFTSIGAVRAAGNSASSSNYVFTDLTVTAPVYYYRLKMTDIDGRFSYSKVIKLSLAAAAGALTIYPNPASDFVIVNLPAATTVLSTLQLTDPAGRIIHSYMLPAGVQQTRLSLGAVSGGIYKLVYRDAGKTTAASLLVR